MPELYQLSEDVLAKILAQISAVDNYAGKRSAPRHAYPARLSIYQEQADGSQREIYVSGNDISHTGIGLHCREELALKELVVVVLEHDDASLACHAKVAHCTQTLNGFRVGLKWEFC